MFDKAKQMWELQKKARAIQKELRDLEIEAKSADGGITVVFNGEQKLQRITISESWLAPSKKAQLEDLLLKTISEAITRTQAVAAEKMKAIAGDLNLPGF